MVTNSVLLSRCIRGNNIYWKNNFSL